MSTLSSVFPNTMIGRHSKQWPCPGTNAIRQFSSHIGITFDGTNGWVSLKTEEALDTVELISHASKTALKGNPPSMVFNIKQTIQDFLQNGANLETIECEHELEGEELNRAIHMLRIFATRTNNNGSTNTRRSIL